MQAVMARIKASNIPSKAPKFNDSQDAGTSKSLRAFITSYYIELENPKKFKLNITAAQRVCIKCLNDNVNDICIALLAENDYRQHSYCNTSDATAINKQSGKVNKRNATINTKIYDHATHNMRYATVLIIEVQSKTNISGAVLKEEENAQRYLTIQRYCDCRWQLEVLIRSYLRLQRSGTSHRYRSLYISTEESYNVVAQTIIESNLASIYITQNNLALARKSILSQLQGAHFPEALATERYQDEKKKVSQEETSKSGESTVLNSQQ